MLLDMQSYKYHMNVIFTASQKLKLYLEIEGCNSCVYCHISRVYYYLTNNINCWRDLIIKEFFIAMKWLKMDAAM